MAVPLQYQSQFIPTNFGAVDNVLGMYRQDMNQREQQFDAAALAEQQAIAELGALPSYDIEGRAQRLGELEKQFQSAVDKHGGDYGAAAKDLTRIIAKERNNPWYQFNAKQQQAMEDYRKLRLNADNIVIGNPNVNYKEYEQALSEGRDPMNVSALSKNALYTKVSDIAGNWAQQMMSNPQISSTLGGQYFAIMKQTGVTPDRLDAFIETGVGQQIMQSVLASTPELEGVNLDTAKEVIKQGLTSAIGKTDMQLVYNRGYDAKSGGGSGGESPFTPLTNLGQGLIPSSMSELASGVFEERVNSVAKKEAEKLGIPGVNSLEDLRKMGKETMGVKKDIDYKTPMFQGTGFEYNKVSPHYNKAKKALSNIEKMLQDDPQGFSLPTYGLTSLGYASGKAINEINTISKGFNDEIEQRIDKFEPLTTKDADNLKEIESDFKVTEISPNFKKDKAGLVLYVTGRNKDKKIVRSRIYLNPEEVKLESLLVSHLSQLNPIIGYEYRYGKEGDAYIEKLQDDLLNPNYSDRAKYNIMKFIELKSKN